jgi:hypothetical protein
MNNIENDILDTVELSGLTQSQIDKMSNYEIKEFQRNESNEKIQAEKKSVEIAVVSLLFFAVVAAFLYANPILSVYAIIVPAVASLAFAIKANRSHNNLKMEKTSRTMLESFYEENEL